MAGQSVDAVYLYQSQTKERPSTLAIAPPDDEVTWPVYTVSESQNTTPVSQSTSSLCPRRHESSSEAYEVQRPASSILPPSHVLDIPARAQQFPVTSYRYCRRLFCFLFILRRFLCQIVRIAVSFQLPRVLGTSLPHYYY